MSVLDLDLSNTIMLPVAFWLYPGSLFGYLLVTMVMSFPVHRGRMVLGNNRNILFPFIDLLPFGYSLSVLFGCFVLTVF